MLGRQRPRPNSIGSKAAELEGQLVSVIPMLGGSPYSRADCFPLFSPCPFSIKRHALVIKTHVVKIDVPPRKKSKWTDCISRPEAFFMFRWIVEVAHVVQDWSEGKQIYSRAALH